jgi:hypothetical protein
VYEFNLRLVYGNWTNPTKNDSDFDGMADKWEDDNAGLDPTDASDASDDEDTDGLNNLGEFNNNCDPNDSDSEDDGMWDGFEVIFGLNPLIDDSLGDPDDDDLNNLQEFTLRLTYGSWTSPISADSDGDTMTDGWEVYYHSQDPLYLTRPWQSFNPLNASDALLDTKYDNDGLINADEYAHGSNPWDTDSDDDGLSDYDEVETYETDPADTDTDGDQCPDGWEVTYGLDPTKSADGALDIDVDGLANYLEYRFGTKPNVADTDEDDLLDGEEVIKGEDGYITNATNPDTDGDGFTDGEEFLAGTDPTDPNSFPAGLDPVMLIIIFGSIGGGVAAVLGIYFVRKRGGAKVKKGKKKKDIYVPEEYVYKGGEGKK